MSNTVTPIRRNLYHRQRGGFGVGLIVGLLLGLGLALGVALYVTKVPVPFIDKVPQRTPEQDAAEAERMRQWDPNAPLQGRAPGPTPNGASTPGGTAAPPATATAPLPSSGPAVTRPIPPTTAPPPRAATRDPAAILSGAPVESDRGGAALPDSALEFYVQAGAFSRSDDAERQRATLAMMGFGAKVTEREQAGRMIYRVRLGPYRKRADADAARESLDGNGVQAAVVHVQKSAN